MLASVTAPVTSILPGGCYPPTVPTPTRPADPKPWERGCWTPVPIQLPSPSSEVQAVEAAKLLG